MWRISSPERFFNLVRAAIASQNVDAVDDALNTLSSKTSPFAEGLRIDLQGCKLALQRGGQCG